MCIRDRSLPAVNGATVTVPQHPVVLRSDTIQVDGKIIDGGVELTQQHLYFMVNKPKGYLCSNKPGNEGGGNKAGWSGSSGGGGNKLVLDLFEDWRESWRRKHPGKLPPRLFTVGRGPSSTHTSRCLLFAFNFIRF